MGLRKGRVSFLCLRPNKAFFIILYNFKTIDISGSKTEEDIVDEESENFDLEATVRLRQTEKFKSISSLNWKPQIENLGEVAGVDTDNNGDIWVFHR